MSAETPTDTPPTASPPPIPQRAKRRPRQGSDYDRVADTVGLIPNIRVGDNIVQMIVIFVATPVTATVCAFVWGLDGLFIGGACGLVGSLLLSGIVLMVLGWIRAIRR